MPTSRCRTCEGALDAHGWCAGCRRGARLRARTWAELLLDPGAAELSSDVHSGDPLSWPGYPRQRADAPGQEAVRTWMGATEGHEVVLVAFDFAHLGGSAGAGVGERITRAFSVATRRRRPVVVVTATGGSRMQEGMVSLAQMPRLAVARRAHADAGLLQVGVASDPTTGGIYASLLSQLDIVVAEPHAYLGFAGPRVAQALADGSGARSAAPHAAHVNRASSAFAHGLVDGVVDRPDLRAWLARTLAAARSAQPATPPPPAAAPDAAAAPSSAWHAVSAARRRDRPRASSLVAELDDAVHLHGDRCGGRDPGTVAALGRLHGQPLAVAAFDRHAVQPAGYRTIWRLWGIADRLGIPVVTLIDTPGADPSPKAEAAGQAHAIGSTLTRMLALRVPTVAVVIGEGGSGGAMALAAADRLLIQQRAVFSVIAPEGAAAILHHDASRAEEMAEQLRLTADALVDLGIADEVISDRSDAVLTAARWHLHDLGRLPDSERLHRRYRRWGAVGSDEVQQ